MSNYEPKLPAQDLVQRYTITRWMSPRGLNLLIWGTLHPLNFDEERRWLWKRIRLVMSAHEAAITRLGRSRASGSAAASKRHSSSEP